MTSETDKIKAVFETRYESYGDDSSTLPFFIDNLIQHARHITSCREKHGANHNSSSDYLKPEIKLADIEALKTKLIQQKILYSEDLPTSLHVVQQAVQEITALYDEAKLPEETKKSFETLEQTLAAYIGGNTSEQGTGSHAGRLKRSTGFERY